MDGYIIGIAGNKQVGKDTVSSMINYIFSVGVTKAGYIDFVTKENFVKINNEDRIIHFADKLKDVLSIIYNINRKLFDSADYKDYYYYCPFTHKFLEPFIVESPKGKDMYHIADINNLANTSLADMIDMYSNKIVVFKLRTMLQYFGTNVCRFNLSDNIWINSALYDIIEKAKSRRVCIVPDVRFPNEARCFYGGKGEDIKAALIRIIRPGQQTDNHISENNKFDVDYIIINDGTKTSLFYKVLDIVQQIIKK